MSSELDSGSVATTPSPGVDKKRFKGPAPKALPEDTSDVGLGEDGMPLNPGGDQTVQFIQGHDPINGDAKVEIGDSIGTPHFVGLGKEELMKYANDPKWIRLRWTLFILFWLLWVAMLAGAIIIIILAPKCADKQADPDTYYQVHVKSFTENGKLAEIEKRAEYLEGLGVKTVIISQVLETDNGQSVINFENVDPMYGTLENLEKLVEKLKEKSLNVLLQLIPNHASINHPWFNDTHHRNHNLVSFSETNASESSWKNRVDGGSAWTVDPVDPNNSYLHQFASTDADLNYHNSDIKEKMKSVLKFWMSKGVSGFLLSDVSYLLEDLTKLQDPKATINQPGNADIIKEIIPRNAVTLLDVDELAPDSTQFLNYLKVSRSLATPIVSDLLKKLSQTSKGVDVQNIIESTRNLSNVVWRLSGPRDGRLEKKLGSRDRANIVAMVAFMTNGKVILYYGDEVGDLAPGGSLGLDKYIEKMDWTEANKTNTNVQYFTKLMALRRKVNVDAGTHFYNSTEGLFAFKRSSKACTYIVATNFGSTEGVVNFSDLSEPASAKATIALTTPNHHGKENATITEGKITLDPNSGVVLKLDP